MPTVADQLNNYLMSNNISHFAFADEHNHDSGSGRFGGIALITMKRNDYKTVCNRVSDTFSQSKIRSEFKWAKTKQARQKDAAVGLIDLAVDMALEKLIRIDVISWDYNDSRHSIDDRDNIANFHIMYYRLLSTALHKFWPDESVWIFYPDETTCLDWNEVKSFVNTQSIKISQPSLFNLVSMLKSYHIIKIKEVSSEISPVSQLADLFAGLIPYSRKCYSKYKVIEIDRQGETLFKMSDVKIENSDYNRYEIIQRLLSRKEKQKLGISFESSEGFRSLAPSQKYPLNFWWYEPQHEKDKAPIKKDR